MSYYKHTFAYAYRNYYMPLSAFDKASTEKYISHMQDCIKQDNGLDAIIDVDGEKWISPECVEYLHGEGLYEYDYFNYSDYIHIYNTDNEIDYTYIDIDNGIDYTYIGIDDDTIDDDYENEYSLFYDDDDDDDQSLLYDDNDN